MRGIKNVVSAADSAILTEFTDLHIIVVVDNASAAKLSVAADKLGALLAAGMSVDQAFRQSGFKDISESRSFEERVLADLALRSAQRGLLHRFHICPLPTEDIIELLPESAFGLNRSWSELRAEFRRDSQHGAKRHDFKDWLRAHHSAQISTARIGRAFGNLDDLPDPLGALLREIEVVSALSELDR
jgi:hypothetical protein